MKSTYSIGTIEVLGEILGESTWQGAHKRIDGLKGGWRLPSVDEMRYILTLNWELGTNRFKEHAETGFWTSEWEMGEARYIVMYPDGRTRQMLSPFFFIKTVIAVRDKK